MHGNTKGRLYAINYQLTAAMQQMGVGPSAMETLCAFLELANVSAIGQQIAKAEKVLGPIQLKKREESEEEAIREEISATEAAKGTIPTHICEEAGHEHPPLPLLDTNFGNVA